MSAPVQPAPPTLAIVGGAGTMGSLFAESFLSRVGRCLLVDRFPRADGDGSSRAVALAPLVERLTAVMLRRDFEALAVTVDAAGNASLVPPRDLHAAPAWLLFRPRGLPPLADLPSGTDPAALNACLATMPTVQHVVGLFDPSDAMAVAQAANILLVATNYTAAEQFRELMTPYAAGLRPGSLVADLLSIKEAPLRVMAALFQPDVGLLGTHPLFGRAVPDVTGLVVAVAAAPDNRPSVPWQSWLLRQLAELGLLVTPTTAAEHDAAMSYVQALTHFCLLCFAFTFVRANQDPTALLPFRTPVFEPLLYLAARVAAQAQRTPEVYRAIQMECARPELRQLFVATAQDLLRAIDGGEASLAQMFGSLGAPWSPAYHRHAEPYEHLVAMSGTLTEPVNAMRHILLHSSGHVRGMRSARTGAVTLGALYVDPLHHDRVDLASRVRFRRFNLTAGILEGATQGDVPAQTDDGRRRIEASLGSLPLAQVQLLTEHELLDWLGEHTAPRTGPARPEGPSAPPLLTQRPRYAGKACVDLSLLVPDWLDADCLQRLLAGRGDDPNSRAVIWHAALLPQDVPGLTPRDGLRPAIVRLTLLLHPEEVLALRQAARGVSAAAQPDAPRKLRRQQEDRALTASLATRHAALRQFALDWLLAHGCRPVQAAATS